MELKKLQEFFEQATFESCGISKEENGEMGLTIMFSHPDRERAFFLNIGVDSVMSIF